jgi:putative ABC transport system ATP-binding protein
VFQFFQLLPTLSAIDNVMLPMDFAGRLAGRKRADRAIDLLERLGVADQASKLPSTMSGGQQQRVAIARALANSPKVLLADEPTGNLDSKNGEAVMTLLQELHQEGATICMVTHDPRFAAHAERQVHLFDGKIVAEGELSQLMAQL